MRSVLILAGGQASRLPGKLETEFRGEPLIVRVYRNVRAAGPVYIASNRTFPPAIDAALDCPIIVDRHAAAGPLVAAYDALPSIPPDRVFLIGGDMPFATAPLADELEAAMTADASAAVAVDAQGELQPLCAVYDKAALLLAAGETLRAGRRSLKAALERMNAVRVRLQDDRVLAGVNTPEELVAVRTFDLGLHARA